MTDEFFEDENVEDGENNLEYDRDIFDIEIEFDDKERELESLRRKALTEIKEKSLQTEGPL